MMKLDNTDRKLIEMLSRDGRLGLTEMGRVLGLSHVAVAKRLKKLLEREVIKVQAALGIEAVGLRLLVVLMEVEGPERLDEVKRVLEKCPRMLVLATLLAGYNLAAIMFAEDEGVLESITTCCAIRDLPGIKRTEVYVVGKLVKPRFLPLTPAEKRSQVAPCGRRCGECFRYVDGRCVGCPSFTGYRGQL